MRHHRLRVPIVVAIILVSIVYGLWRALDPTGIAAAVGGAYVACVVSLSALFVFLRDKEQ